VRVLLTGGHGFIGAAVARRLVGHEVLLLNHRLLYPIVTFRPHIVIHCAWPGVEAGRMDDELQLEGLLLTERLIPLCMPTCRRWVACGSQAETSTPEIPYARRKRQAFEITRAAARAHNVSFTWARLFSVYGPGEPAGSFLSYLIGELLAGRDPALTDQNIPWDFLYVDDAADALIQLAFAQDDGLFDVASGETVYTQDAARRVRDKIGPRAELRFGARRRRPLEIDGLWPYVGRLEATSWRPVVSFDDGLDRLIASIKQVGP
jgi:nucleoside-diphosphate-sugar epimerase